MPPLAAPISAWLTPASALMNTSPAIDLSLIPLASTTEPPNWSWTVKPLAGRKAGPRPFWTRLLSEPAWTTFTALLGSTTGLAVAAGAEASAAGAEVAAGGAAAADGAADAAAAGDGAVVGAGGAPVGGGGALVAVGAAVGG